MGWPVPHCRTLRISQQREISSSNEESCFGFINIKKYAPPDFKVSNIILKSFSKKLHISKLDSNSSIISIEAEINLIKDTEKWRYHDVSSYEDHSAKQNDAIKCDVATIWSGLLKKNKRNSNS
ncbi:hypothetical protein CEXT_492171 [Caerostris extrusa]|uniref:Uncharacterized protein n=1 Tax=Caerostris extrusa TaxID=172846 RepID=A0AAV4NMT9_CAEEX|nr:hypothetical protein CEXT_492171 [Caerostris extrusa]